jgi:GWxTD domain-containing protein
MIQLINGIAESWFSYMASATLQATVLALFFLGILQIGRRWSPALRYALMMLALCKFVIPPMLSLPTGLLNRIQPQQWAGSAPPLRYVAPVAQNALGPVNNVYARDMQALSRASSPKPSLTLNGRLVLLHLSGALLILAAATLQKIRLRRLASCATTAQDPALADAYDALCRSMNLIRKPRLLISSDNQAPITFGAWKSVVMLPQSLVAALPLSEIRVILGHELAHNRRRDPWIAWLQVIISAIWWFNPVYWLLIRSIRGVREDCCDDMVLASGLASREVYCRTLLKAARAALENKAVTRAAFAYLGKSQPLRRRFKRIMSAKSIRAPKLAATGMLVIFALALLLLPGVEPRILAQNAALAEGPVAGTTPAPQQRYSKALERVYKEDGERNYILGDLRAEQPHVQKRNVVGGKADSSPSVFTRMDEYIRMYGTNPPDQQQPQSSQESAISGYYRKWLDEDVLYITTQEERNAFLALRTDQERGVFIEQFWARRTPNPRQADNAFKEEHYRRIAYANQHFASSAPGWKTDRGRIYILYGKPDEIESHPTGSAYNRPIREGGGMAITCAFEKWRYKHIDGIGDDIEIEFVDPSGTSEYHMAMSPDEKITQNNGAFTGPLIYDIRTDYIKQSIDRVSVPITIELSNKDLGFMEAQGLGRATVNIYGKVTSLTGRINYEWEDVISVEHSDEFFQTGKNKRSQYRKIIALRPGQRYKLDLILKDVNGKQTGTRSLELDVPAF